MKYSREEIISALELSVKKWEEIIKGGDDKGTENCALCRLFYADDFFKCSGCPVHEKTQEQYCEATPYINWACSTREAFPRNIETAENSEVALQYAKEELEFLQNLLKEYKENGNVNNLC